MREELTSRPDARVRFPSPFDTPPPAATQGEGRGVGGLRGFFTPLLSGLLIKLRFLDMSYVRVR